MGVAWRNFEGRTAVSVYRGTKSPYFLFDFVWQGRRYYGSTKRTNRADAEQFEKGERERAQNSHPHAARSASVPSRRGEPSDRSATEVGQQDCDNLAAPHCESDAEWRGSRKNGRGGGRGSRLDAAVHTTAESGLHRYSLRTPKYAAERLACSYKTLVGYVRAGTLKYVKVGNGTKRPRRMFTDTDLDEFVVNQTRRDASPHQPAKAAARRPIVTISGGNVPSIAELRNAQTAARQKGWKTKRL